jgi:hypothetical protein
MELDPEMYSSWCEKTERGTRLQAQFFPRRYTACGVKSPWTMSPPGNREFSYPAFDVKLYPGGLMISENRELFLPRHRIYQISQPEQIREVLENVLDTTVDRWPGSWYPRILPDFYEIKIFPWANVPDDEVSWLCTESAIRRLQEYWVPDRDRLSEEEKQVWIERKS